MLVAQLYSTLCSPVVCSPPGSSVHGILQARIPEWLLSRGDLPDPGIKPRDQTQVSCIMDRLFTLWTTRKVLSRYINRSFCFGHSFQKGADGLNMYPCLRCSISVWKKKKARVSDSCRIQQVAVFSLRCSRLPYHSLREGSQPDFLCIYW